MFAFSRIRFTGLLLAAGLACGPAGAAESYDSCTGFIDSLPATITTQGNWCLHKNLSTNITTGNAITIATNNVTIDCNDFKIGGLAAGNASIAKGILASGRQNATVRHCNVRGFHVGIHLDGGAGHLLEDNRLDNSLWIGMWVAGDNNQIRRNTVYDTGGHTGAAYSYGIYASGDIIDNTVSGLFAGVSGGILHGIVAEGEGAHIHGNRVLGFDMAAAQGGATSGVRGIVLSDPYQRASGNQVVGGGPGAMTGYGIDTPNNSSFCLDNTVGGFVTNIDSDCISSGNLTPP